MMSVASGLVIFVAMNTYSDVCFTCNWFDNITTEKIEPSVTGCQFGYVNNRCMFEDEYYTIQDMKTNSYAQPLVRTLDQIPQQIKIIENNQACVNVDGKIWCNQP